MQSMTVKTGSLNFRQIIRIILALICVSVLIFFIIRYVPWSRNDDEAELLRLVSESNPLAEEFRPELIEVEGVAVSESCAEALRQMLAAAEEAGCSPVLLDGYLSRQEQQERADRAEAISTPGADEHELGLTVDIVDKSHQQRDMELTESDTYKWLSRHCWEYGFVIRYPEDKSDVTGREFMPWHYRYVGIESAQLMQELQLCLEEYYTWFYSDDVIVIS